MKATAEQMEQELSQFTGTSKYHSYNSPFAPFNMTDGVHYVAEKGGAFWMLDVISSYQFEPKVRDENFQVYKFSRTDGTMELVIEDGDENILATQQIGYSDFPLDQIEIWKIGNVALLPSEY